ncbi:MAG: response regulator transcription factor [Clostridium sp.]|jgi:DNA-binding response OmpR family regulator|uniref:response regulator transcription factor n=1 Tax=Clostridium sp. TaxID=1506 RepID=UPI0025C24F39|nr:response regulator transcription factor [Clostridium sp.]MCH3964247.1 response regulator transcription factor [Clostridium sp.]MCI1715427.1 response regulator transcription factor [Clostridium sp.]MCI1799782.1 response regulator transcription factor [Clostridium sp.]MCI1813610.1 response regulator transcription factor [Clostridium sp.]MCI1870599.1 response regulator transcription factor [Clostridium sp.]
MKKILIIEDDLSIAELQKDYLELNKFKVTICTDGIKGLDTLVKEDFDLLILDIMLPEIDGYSILKSIRDKKDIPVLLVSAKKEEIDRIKGFTLGADDYITKPFSPGELVARVKSHINNYERIKNKFAKKRDSITIRGLEIFRDSMQVFVNGNEVELAQKEFELLLYMAENPNRVFSRETLFEKIWGLDSLGDNATVTVHIRRIREKIETSPSEPQYIETVWGAGYRMRA